MALAACRAGGLAELLHARPTVARWAARRYLRSVVEVAGNGLSAEAAWALLLRWAVSRLRPDRVAGLEGIAREAWLERTSWRPLLAIACHYGFMPVATFKDRYHPRADESAADHLCGLWSVGPSTFYRYVDKGRRQLAEVVTELAGSGDARTSLREAVLAQLRPSRAAEPSADTTWHLGQASRALAEGEAFTALLHFAWAHDATGAVDVLRRHAIPLANHPDTQQVLQALQQQALGHRARFDLLLASGEFHRVSHQAEREMQAYEQALHTATEADDSLMLGLAYSALGKYHEPRDADRAFACYEDGVEFLRRAGLDTGDVPEPEVLEAYVTTLIRLGWLYVLRSDGRAKAALDRVEHIRSRREIAPANAGLLEQVWGEYWRRAGELRRALEHKHRALNVFERIGDQRSVLVTCVNLAPIYAQLKDYDRAVAYSKRILSLGETVTLEPEMACSARLNLGATYFWQGRHADAIDQYEQALRLAEDAALRLHARRAHYNLAEAFYTRCQLSRDPADEARGDAHAAAALKVWPDEHDPTHIEATKSLKGEILGKGGELNFDRLLPEEYGAHFAEMSEVQRQRAVLAIPAGAEAHVAAHLAIAKAYVSVAMKEREAALMLMQRHSLMPRFELELHELSTIFSRQLTREESLLQRWKHSLGDLLPDERRAALIDRLVRGEPISKSTYAELCSVGLATASKHLGLMAERGLLVQVGKGPKTRYLLAP